MTSDPYLAERHALVAAVARNRGSLAPEVRQAIIDRAAGRPEAEPVPAMLRGFVDKAARDATEISDADITALTVTGGFDEEAVFEAIVGAALGASLARLERADALLAGAD